MKLIHYILSNRRIFGDDIVNTIKLNSPQLIELNSKPFNIENSIFELCLNTSGGINASCIPLEYEQSEYPRSGMMNSTVFYDKFNDILYAFYLNRVYNEKNFIVKIEGLKPDLVINSSIVSSEDNGSIITFNTALNSIKFELRDFISAYGDVALPYSDTIVDRKKLYFNNELTYTTGRGKLFLDIKNIFNEALVDYTINTDLKFELNNGTYIFTVDKPGIINIVPNKIKKVFLFGETIEISLGHLHINVL